MVRVLCTGDIHIGRPIAGIPEGSPIEALKTADAWRAIVDLALRESPDLLAISGDIIDERNKYFEAIGPVEDGLRMLAEAEIPVVAVAGNHDWDVLPAIARNNPGLIHLVGLNQQWQRHTIMRDGRPLIHIDGWSFGGRHVADDPLDSYRETHPGTAPVLGLVHVDLDAAERRYAPTPCWKLQAQAVDAWLIGHIHAPRLIEEASKPPVLYPGSPFALHAGEPGVHGVWMLEIVPGLPPRFTQIPISPVRFESLTVDVTGGMFESEVSERIEREVRSYFESLLSAHDGSHLKLLQLRIILTGKVPLNLSLTEMLRGLPARLWPAGPASAIVTQVDQATTLDLKIEQIAGSTGIPGTLASLITDGGSELRSAVKAEIEAMRKKRDFSPLAEELEISDDEILLMFETEAWRLMDALIAQQEAVRS